ncbi:MAG: hypothetical protein LBU22_09685 [Dysgonamonadaceae bacterium]|jgi:hypothetical protein|nr:hypothetical protein [Dysgonamonadaceae bacterium]
MKKLLIYTIIVVCGNVSLFSQQIDLTKPKDMVTKDKWLSINGGFSASSIYYTGNEPNMRDPFNYFLSGNVNFNIMGLIDMPFSFNFTNSGANYAYPTMPNRLSLHPKYKFLTGHIGDVSMNFSPYTLNGHQFTGVGLDVEPNNPFKCSIMYGRLLKAVEFGEGRNEVTAAYQRMGTGIHLRYEKSRYRLAASLFAAKDKENSLLWKPDSLLIFPKQNLAGSFTAGFELLKNMQLTAEYGISHINHDIRLKTDEKEQTYHAFKMMLNYTFLNNTLGIGYERIDPEYRTLGAYYFNNDLENITLNYARPFFNNKATIALSGGVQRDNLKKESESETRRFVFSADAAYSASDKLNFSAAYTTFQTHMNLRSQFDYINELTPYDNLDTLNFTQLSQNVNFNTVYIFGQKERQQQLNLFLSYQEAADKQGDIIPDGASSLFFNTSLGYGLQLAPQGLNINFSLNTTNSRMDKQEMFIAGPSLGITAQLFNKKVSSGIVGSYNLNYLAGTKQNEVWNLRFNASYVLLKKHSLAVSAIYRNNASFNQSTIQARSNGLTLNASYSYKF